MPDSYSAFGSAIILKSKYKIVPPIANRTGALFLNHLYKSDMFEIDIELSIDSNPKTAEGIAIWYLRNKIPSFPEDFGKTN